MRTGPRPQSNLGARQSGNLSRVKMQGSAAALGRMSWHPPEVTHPAARIPLVQGADIVEGQKLYARIFRALSSLGIRI